jgi:SAM-dependent methyltransferase
MVDRQFSDVALAALYDAMHPWQQRGDFQFALPLIMGASSVLDIGCGTGSLLHRAREAGHTGRLCGIDPAGGMLAVARTRTDIEWVEGDVVSAGWRRQFDLIVMTGHAFQVFLGDDELHATLVAIRDALTDTGRFVFETRNPLVRAWEAWTPDEFVEAIAADGSIVRMDHTVDPIDNDGHISFTTRYTSDGWSESQTSRSTLRFLHLDELNGFLDFAGLKIDEQFGDWDRSTFTDSSPEIITIARRRTEAG